MAKIIKINKSDPNDHFLKIAADTLVSGGSVVYPTDTAYGLGVNALDEKAVKKMYQLKGRDKSKPTHVVVKDWEMIDALTYTNKIVKKVYDKFLPGPITLVLPKKDNVPNLLTADLPTLGVRIPDSEITKKISRMLSFPYTTTSANRNGESTPYNIEVIKKSLDTSKIDLILDAGELQKILPSTMIEIHNNDIKLLREGPISLEDIEKVID